MNIVNSLVRHRLFCTNFYVTIFLSLAQEDYLPIHIPINKAVIGSVLPTKENALNENNTRLIWITEQMSDVASDSEMWNHATV